MLSNVPFSNAKTLTLLLRNNQYIFLAVGELGVLDGLLTSSVVEVTRGVVANFPIAFYYYASYMIFHVYRIVET